MKFVDYFLYFMWIVFPWIALAIVETTGSQHTSLALMVVWGIATPAAIIWAVRSSKRGKIE